MKLRQRAGAWLILGLAWGTTAGAMVAGSAIMVAASCQTIDRRVSVPTIRGPLSRVCDRVASYGAADDGLLDSERAALSDGVTGLRALLELEHLEPGLLESAGLVLVAAYHDLQVLADPTLIELERRVYLGDSDAVLQVAQAASSYG